MVVTVKARFSLYSAGVGRTGTFICLDYIMQFIRNRPMSDKLDIFKFILQMREYRCRMVQTVVSFAVRFALFLLILLFLSFCVFVFVRELSFCLCF